MKEPQTFGQMIDQETEFKDDPLKRIASELSNKNKPINLKGKYTMNITKENILAQVNNIVRGEDAQAYIEAAFDLLADTVVSTLGPNGRSVIYGGQTPMMTKDGVSVSNQVVVKDPLLDSTMRLIKDGSRYSDSSVGDGTTTTMMMARAFYQLGKRLMVDLNLSPYQVKKELDNLNREVVQLVRKHTTPVLLENDIVDEHLLSKVITTSVNGDTEMANVILEAITSVNDYSQLKLDNVITVKKGNQLNDELIVSEGMHYSCGYQHPNSVNASNSTVEYKNALIMMYNDVVGDDTATISEVLKHVYEMSGMGRPIVLLAEKFSDRAIKELMYNDQLKRVGCQLCLVKLPDHGDQQSNIIEDLTYVLNLQPLLSNDDKHESHQILWYGGNINHTIITRTATTFIPDERIYTNEFTKHVDQLKESISLCRDDYDKGKMLERLQSLNGKMITISVGGITETERKERKDRFDDGVGAGCAAVLGGVVPGGGRTLNYIASQWMLDSSTNITITQAYCDVLDTPIRQLCRNSGITEVEVIDNIVRKMISNGDINLSYDIVDNKHNVDLFEKGVLDAAKVTESALIAGMSVAMSLLTTNGIMVLPMDMAR